MLFLQSSSVIVRTLHLLPFRSLFHCSGIVIHSRYIWQVPFRLTQNMMDGFGPAGPDGAFRRCCEITLQVCYILDPSLHHH